MKYLDLQLEEFNVADGLLEHGDHVDLGAVGHKLLQRPEPLADPLPPILQQGTPQTNVQRNIPKNWSGVLEAPKRRKLQFWAPKLGYLGREALRVLGRDGALPRGARRRRALGRADRRRRAREQQAERAPRVAGRRRSLRQGEAPRGRVEAHGRRRRRVARLWRRGGGGVALVHSVDPRVAFLLLLLPHSRRRRRRRRGAVERQHGRGTGARPGVPAARHIGRAGRGCPSPEQRRGVKAQQRVVVAVDESFERRCLGAVEASVRRVLPH
uniref:Uncharacterized protein n=1 Tax=Setaria italica TaxID=4555 RepID=K3YUZ9_SETIT